MQGSLADFKALLEGGGLPASPDIAVDVAKLVKCVHLSPTSEAWFHDVVVATAEQFGFDFKIQKSNLYSGPRS